MYRSQLLTKTKMKTMNEKDILGLKARFASVVVCNPPAAQFAGYRLWRLSPCLCHIADNLVEANVEKKLQRRKKKVGSLVRFQVYQGH